jgi:hypothetical protein
VDATAPTVDDVTTTDSDGCATAAAAGTVGPVGTVGTVGTVVFVGMATRTDPTSARGGASGPERPAHHPNSTATRTVNVTLARRSARRRVRRTKATRIAFPFRYPGRRRCVDVLVRSGVGSPRFPLDERPISPPDHCFPLVDHPIGWPSRTALAATTLRIGLQPRTVRAGTTARDDGGSKWRTGDDPEPSVRDRPPIR